MRVWVTRDESPDGPLTTALRGAGLTPVLEPVLTRRVVDDAAGTITTLGADDWLVLTSVYAIESVAAEPARIPRVAVVGEASQSAAEVKGLRVELVSRGGDGASLWDELKTRATTGRVCYPRSSLAKAPAPWPGVELLCPILYETVPRPYDSAVANRVDVVAVTSPSAVEAVGPLTLPFASIGPTTSDALRSIGIEPWVEAPHRSFASLAEAIAGQSDSSRHQRA